MPPLLDNLHNRVRLSLLSLPLPVKCLAITITILALHSALLLTASARGNGQLMEQQQTLLAEQWVRQIAFQTQQGMMQSDKLALLSVLRLHVENPLLNYARIADNEGRVLVEAGEDHPELRAYSSEIHIGKDIAGTISIGFDSSLARIDRGILNTQLFILAGVLTGLIATFLFMASSKLDRLLQKAGSELLRPSEDPAPSDYSAKDSLGELLAAVHQQRAELPELTTHENNWFVLHLHWQHFKRLSQQWGKTELDRRLARSYQIALALSRVYHGELEITRNDGLSLRFSALENADDPLLRSLCCGWLLQALDKDLGASPRIGMLRSRGNRYQLAANQSALIESLAKLSGSGIQTSLSGDTDKLLDQWIDRNDSGLELKSRYRALLEKQLARLQEQLDSSAGQSAEA